MVGHWLRHGAARKLTLLPAGHYAERRDAPDPTKRTNWSFYLWSEAHSLAVHFRELAFLANVSYRGRYHPRIAANRWLGHHGFSTRSGNDRKQSVINRTIEEQ